MPFNIYGQRALTRLEAALYGGIAAILVTFLAYRLLDVMELAERAAMESTVQQVNAIVTTRLAYEVMRGAAANTPAWAKRNPFELAGMSPSNFVGTVDSTRPDALETGTWGFDASTAELVYRPRLRTGLHTSDSAGTVHFKAVMASNGFSYMLVPTPPYRWE